MLTSDYEIFHYYDKKLNKIDLHHHDFYELFLFLSGNVSYIIEGKSYLLESGDIVLINSRELHQPIMHNSSIPYERIVLWLNKAFIKSLSSENVDLSMCFESSEKKNVLRSDFEVHQNVKTILCKLLSLEKYEGLGRNLLYNAYIVELLVFLNTILFAGNIKLDVEIKNSNLIDNVIQYINEHIEDDINIDELSNKFFISKFHMLREFKKYSGTTIYKFIIQKRLIIAKELILQGIPITDVYMQCGFGDYCNFFRAFKNEYGVTPKQFYELNTSRNSSINNDH